MNGYNSRIEKAKIRIKNYSRLKEITQTAAQRTNVQKLKKGWLRDTKNRRQRSNMYFIGVLEVDNENRKEVITKLKNGG